MSLTINEDSNYLKPHTFQNGDLIFIVLNGAIYGAIYVGCKSEHKIYYHLLSSPWGNRDVHFLPYVEKCPDGQPSWLYRKINNPGMGTVDFTNSHAIRRIMPIPKEMCTKKLLEIQHDYKKARNLL